MAAASSGTDLGRLVITVEARTKAIEKQLGALVKQAANDAGTIEKRWDQAGRTFDRYGASVERGGKQVVASLGQQRAAAANLSFQLQDISQGLLAGTSPFTLMAQQGGQVVQALQSAGGGVKGLFGVIGSAASMVINPLSLATFAVIGLTAAATKYFSTLGSETVDKDALLKAHAETIKTFDEVWGYAEQAVRSYSKAEKELALADLADKIGDFGLAAKAASTDLLGMARNWTAADFGGDLNKVEQFTKALGLLRRDIPDFRNFAAAMLDIEGGDFPEPVKELAKAMRQAAMENIKVQQGLEETEKRLRAANNTMEGTKAAFAALTSAALGLGKDGPAAVTSVADAFKNQLLPQIGTAITRLGELFDGFLNLQKQVEQSPLGTLPPLYSAGGNFMNEAGYSQYAADRTLSQFERANPKSFLRDQAVNEAIAARVDALDDAFAAKLAEMLKAFPGVKIVSAARTYDEQKAIRDSGVRPAAKEGTSLHEKGLAVDLRIPPETMQALQAAAAGFGLESLARIGDPGHFQPIGARASAGGRSAGTSTANSLADAIRQTQEMTAVLEAENAALGRTNVALDQQAYALEYARKATELLNIAKRDGTEASPAEVAAIDAAASAYARQKASAEGAKTAADALAKSQAAAARSAEEFAGIAKDAISGFVSDLRSGKSEAEAFSNLLEKLGDKLFNLGLDMLFNPTSSGGAGLLGGLAKLFGFAAGGKVRGPGTGTSDSIPARLSNGEYVVNARSAAENEGILDAINAGRSIRLAAGGPVGRRSAPTLSGARGRGGSDAMDIKVGVSVADDGSLQAYVEKVSRRNAARAGAAAVKEANRTAPAAVAKRQAESAGADYRL